jgi:PKD repeat protein
LHPLIVEITSTITVIGTDGADHDISKTITFDLPTILPGIDFIPPVARIVTDPSPPSGNIPITVSFDASSSTDNRGIASYLWNFGDGTTSTSVVVSHTYNTPGSYPVTLTVTDYFNNQHIDTVTVAVGDSDGPTAAISTIPAPPNVGTGVTIKFIGTASAVSGDCGCGTTIVSYEWDFGDDETDSGSIVNHDYDAAGTYTVTLTVTDSNGKSAVTSVTVTIS